MALEMLDDKVFVYKTRPFVSDDERRRLQEEFESDFADRVMTFGDVNTFILDDILAQEGHDVRKPEICSADDDSIGLRMPNVWYLNRGIDAISIAMYYNGLQFRNGFETGTLIADNVSVAKEFGRVAMIELYLFPQIENFLKTHGMDYFGTTKTLTEGMRVLEGWDVEACPRLKDYVDFAASIKEWCRSNCDCYDDSQWELGKEASKKLLKETGTTNVRECIKKFWKEHLLTKEPRIAQGDVEIDIVDGRFAYQRSPDVVLLGENFLDVGWAYPLGNCSQFQLYPLSSAQGMPYLVENDGKDLKTAGLVRKKFPDSDIIIFRTPGGLPRFTLTKADGIKCGISDEVLHVYAGLMARDKLYHGGKNA